MQTNSLSKMTALRAALASTAPSLLGHRLMKEAISGDSASAGGGIETGIITSAGSKSNKA